MKTFELSLPEFGTYSKSKVVEVSGWVEITVKTDFDLNKEVDVENIFSFKTSVLVKYRVIP
jgi:hypothetical protein